MAKTFGTPPCILFGVNPYENSWLAWQLNSATFTWGEHIDELLRQNTLTDAKGKPRFRHDIAGILGLRQSQFAGKGVDVSDLPLLDAEEWEDELKNAPAKPKRKGGKQPPVHSAPIATKRFRNPLDLITEYQQRGRSDTSIVKTSGDLLSTTGGPTIKTPEPEETPKAQLDENGEVYKRPPITFKNS